MNSSDLTIKGLLFYTLPRPEVIISEWKLKLKLTSYDCFEREEYVNLSLWQILLE